MRRPGFSLLEVTIVMALVLVMVATTLPSLGSFQRRETLRTVSQDVLQALIQARNRAQTGERGGSWGVELLNGSYVLYAGDSYAARQTAYDEPRSVSPAISFSGLTQPNFRRGSGTPVAAGTLTLTHVAGSTARIIIGSAGSISFPATCGNDSIGVGESCDDGNTIDGDGCSATCQVEFSFSSSIEG